MGRLRLALRILVHGIPTCPHDCKRPDYACDSCGHPLGAGLPPEIDLTTPEPDEVTT